jgi:GTPase
MTTKIPLVAIIGLPNAGKSTLFNKILEQRKALIHEQAGTTRDRHYGLASWNGRSFYLIDTAGIVNRPDSPLEKNVQKQTAIALSEADMVILIADGKTPVSAGDFAVAKRLSRSKKPVILAVNKIDSRSAKTVSSASDYQRLGLGEPILVSATSGAGLGDLLDSIISKLKIETTAFEDPQRLKIAFVGKPNVGKSSLINKLLKEERLLVDKTAGTTRSTIDIPFEFESRKYLLLDTAGIKKKWKQDFDIEAAAAMQSLRTIPQTDVIVLILSASEPVTFQDQAIASEVIQRSRPVVIALNKADLLSLEQKDSLLDRLPDFLPHLWWAPVVFTSALNGEGLVQMLKLAWKCRKSSEKEIEAAELDSFLDEIIKRHMPGKMSDQRAPKIYNIKQVSIRPPVFKMTVNFPAAIASAWKKFFEKQLRLKFGFEGTPIVILYAKRK